MSLASVQEYQSSHLLEGKVAGGNYSQAEIQLYLNYATGLLEASCKQRLEAVDEVETFRVGSWHAAVDPQGILVCSPSFFPVTAITSFKYRTTPATLWDDAAEFTTSDYAPQYQNFNQSVTIEVPFNNYLRRGMWAEVQFAYTHGYAAGAAPNEIKEAVILSAYALISVGFAIIEADTNQARTLIPSWMWSKYIGPVIARYTRRF